jgi:MYXO-CTERM domain-containing protein
VACATCGVSGCGNAQPDDSRLFQVKSGLSSVVAAFGEVEYSLMRFHQRATDFGCPTASAGLRSGGWQGGGVAPCGGGFAGGDLLVSFAQDNEATILTWMDHDSDYIGVPPNGTDWEIRGSGTTPLAGILASANTYMDGTRDVDPKQACRPYRVILVTDGAETCGGNPAAAAATRRNNGIPVFVFGFATRDRTVIANLNSIAQAGGTVGAIFVNDEAALSDAIADIIADSILFETCNAADDDCDTLVDEDFPDKGDACDNGQQGECARPGQMVCSANGQTTVCNAPAVTPGTESCNGLDDDCDGFTDEGLGASCTCHPASEICNGRDDDCDTRTDEGVLPGVGNTCGTDVGACSPGAIACTAGSLSCQGATGPVAESCNSVDDDCDTFIDEISVACYEFPSGCDLTTGTCEGVCGIGHQTCDGNQLGACVGDIGPGTETCNGVDDDCDGTVDDGFGLGTTCDNGLTGSCFATGQIVCDGAGGTTCTAPIIPPGVETCNGEDDDCNGEVDEAGDLGPPIGNSCGAGGACGVGVFECDNGEIVCVGSQTGTAEACNNADDDCDLTVDEDVPGTGGDCVPTEFDQYQDIGACEFGHLECVAGGYDCEDYVGPSPEIPCNGVDEDCNGLDDQTCPGDQGCIQDACRNPCAPGEFPCPLDFICENTFCVPDPCANVDCAPGFECDPDLDPPACVDLCDSVACPGDQQCVNGLCQDCFALGCPDGEICVRDATSQLGMCTADLCANVTCDTGEFCRDGECIAEGCDPTCLDGQLCIEGECLDDPCGGRCVDDQICNPDTGRCQMDECNGRVCDPGETCNPYDGTCIPDPCLQIDCGTGFECVVLPDGSGTCFNPPPPPTEVIFAGGNGCAAGGSSSSGLGGLALVALSLVWVRRRRR